MIACSPVFKHSQQGVSAIEFAIVAAFLIIALFGIIEFGRLFFTINSVQEITRRAAREQVVRRMDATDAVQHMAVLRPGISGPVNFPGSPDIVDDNVILNFYNTYDDAFNDNARITGTTPEQNLINCRAPAPDNSNCINFVRATLAKDSVKNSPRVPFEFIALFGFGPGLVPFGIVPIDQDYLLPYTTVIMPAEALGLQVD